ncbi:MAG: hypothetical protein K1X74_17685 [Pirellulales bacterium]|nr:hypothetical protein [Pirellulales bacterium]
MSAIRNLMFGMILGGAGVYVGLKYHVVNTNEGLVLVPKLEATFADSYIDVRKFTPNDWNERRQLVAAIVKADKQDIIQDSAVDGLKRGVGDLLNRLGYTQEKPAS